LRLFKKKTNSYLSENERFKSEVSEFEHLNKILEIRIRQNEDKVSRDKQSLHSELTIKFNVTQINLATKLNHLESDIAISIEILQKLL
jgi:hypothetical protein